MRNCYRTFSECHVKQYLWVNHSRYTAKQAERTENVNVVNENYQLLFIHQRLSS